MFLKLKLQVAVGLVESCHCLMTIGDRDSSHKVSIVPRLGIRSDRVLCQGCLFEPVSACAYFCLLNLTMRLVPADRKSISLNTTPKLSLTPKVTPCKHFRIYAVQQIQNNALNVCHLHSKSNFLKYRWCGVSKILISPTIVKLD